MITVSKIDRKDLGALRVLIDWDDNRKLYVSSRDLSVMLGRPVYPYLVQYDDCIPTPKEEDGLVYFDVQSILLALSRDSDVNIQRVKNWIEKDILPSIQAMPMGTPLKL